MKIPNPRELGFPEKYAQWRDVQRDALDFLLHRSPRRVKAVSAPVGAGKSGIYVAYALLTKRPTCFVTESRGLQDQLLHDFERVGMVDIRGRRNYDCPMRPDFSCEDGHAANCPYKGSPTCPSSQAEMRAASSYLVVTNYDKWTAARKFGQGMEHFQQVVFDEGHNTADALARSMSVSLTDHEIEETLQLDFPQRGTDEFVNWKPWIASARSEAAEALLRARALMLENPRQANVRRFTHLKNITKRLSVLSGANPDNWIVDVLLDEKRSPRGFKFDPVRVGRYAESALFMRLPHILVTSGTLRPKSLHMLGLPGTGFDFIEYNSDFDPKRCPIYYVPRLRVDRNAQDLSALWLLLDQIAARRTDRNGIVHTISYLRRDEILARSRFAPSMLVNPKGEAPTEIIEQFIRRYPGAILVSPSVGAGYDFAGKACEWQFLCKIPFPDSRAKIIQARQADDKEYGPYQALNKMQQAFGRIMRYPQDQGESFIADMHLDWFLPRYSHLAARSFHNFFKRVDVVPPPLPRL